MLTGGRAIARAGLDGISLKPGRCDLERAAGLSVETLVVDYEGREHLPDVATLRTLADGHDLRVTTPVRVDGFDPLGDDARSASLPDGVGRVLVAGNRAYFDDRERGRAIAPRLAAAREAHPDAWVGTEGVERLALALGGTQFELYSPTVARDVRALRTAGFEDGVAVYAPVVWTDDEDAVLDALGRYVARRGPVADALPEGAALDATATGRARTVLLDAVADYALVGTPDAVGERVDGLRTAGVDRVIAYPAGGLDGFLD